MHVWRYDESVNFPFLTSATKYSLLLKNHVRSDPHCLYHVAGLAIARAYKPDSINLIMFLV